MVSAVLFSVWNLNLPQIILHLKANHLDAPFSVSHLRLYDVISSMMERQGVQVVRRQRDADIRVGTRKIKDDRFDDGNLHIIDDRSLQMPNVLNGCLAYFKGFWHLDPVGTRFLSSISDLCYDDSQVLFRHAKPFYRRLQSHYRISANHNTINHAKFRLLQMGQYLFFSKVTILGCLVGPSLMICRC
ncbi:MAG: hypothetical protein COB16_19210 [Rhodobacteraceae bacterium]|nr:MAG: hypothetical protein COB16_19210 [Paracoccaceae bacterium]